MHVTLTKEGYLHAGQATRAFSLCSNRCADGAREFGEPTATHTATVIACQSTTTTAHKKDRQLAITCRQTDRSVTSERSVDDRAREELACAGVRMTYICTRTSDGSFDARLKCVDTRTGGVLDDIL
jgi:hypothetical protein